VKQEKQKQKHDTCETNVQYIFFARKKKQKQGYDKKMYQNWC
jgi:hypothetical protein